jgi:lysophospholipase L1-like esterase
VVCACGSDDRAGGRTTGATTAVAWAGSRDDPPDPPRPPAFEGTDGTWVLHVGDSFAGGPLAETLRARFESVGAKEAVVAKKSTATLTWVDDPDLDAWLARRPSLVLITLGANELYDSVPNVRARAIHTIARKAGAVASCVWLAPPIWRKDTSGWLQTIHDHCDPCLFFDSDAVLGGLQPDERRADGIHPNGRGGARWADAFWGWLEDHRDRTRRGWHLDPFVERY